MSLTERLSSIATSDPCDEGKNEGVAEEQVSSDTNTKMKDIGQNGKYHFLYFGKILQRLSGCMSLDFLITVPHGCFFSMSRVGIPVDHLICTVTTFFCFFRSRMSVSRSITGRPTTEMVFRVIQNTSHRSCLQSC